MDGVGLSQVPVVTNEKIIEAEEKPNIIVLKDVPDTFEKKQKATAGGIMLACAGSLSVGTGCYKFVKNGISKAMNGIEKEMGNLFKDLGKNFKGIPNKVKVAGQYGGALAAAIGSALLIFKDSDKDGKLDIIESLQKFVNPD